jgi:hypothetical protein
VTAVAAVYAQHTQLTTQGDRFEWWLSVSNAAKYIGKLLDLVVELSESSYRSGGSYNWQWKHCDTLFKLILQWAKVRS